MKLNLYNLKDTSSFSRKVDFCGNDFNEPYLAENEEIFTFENNSHSKINLAVKPSLTLDT